MPERSRRDAHHLPTGESAVSKSRLRPINDPPFNGVEARIKREPDAPGWWMRKRGNDVELFEIHLLDDGLAVLATEIESFLSIDRYCSPLTRWYGPLRPWEHL
jgi:hypothetical protein